MDTEGTLVRLETMMQIHKTQNLNSLEGIIGSNSQSTVVKKADNEFRHRKYYMAMRKPYLSQMFDDLHKDGDLSFKGKKDIVKVFTKAVDKEKWYTKLKNKILDHSFFDKILDIMEHEVVIQSIISLVVCGIFRPITINMLPAKDKRDNLYASAHSIASAIVGVIASIIIALPFSKGVKHLQKTAYKNLNEAVLKKMSPHLDINSIWENKAKNARKPMEEWLDVYGNKFTRDTKNVIKVARPKHITEVSEETLRSIGVDIDLNAMKGKPVNEWVDRQGKKIHIDTKDMFIAVKEEGMGGALQKEGYPNVNFFSLEHIDKDFLKEVMPKLDIKSIEKDGKRVHPDLWKTVDGKPFKLDMDQVHISSFQETSASIPLYTGLKRTESDENKTIKYVSYQINNGVKDKTRVPDKLGSPISQKSLDAEDKSSVKYKIITWIPDILTRVFVASATIKLIPIILKNIFHLEKHKKQDEAVIAEQSEKTEAANVDDDTLKDVKTSGKEVA